MVAIGKPRGTRDFTPDEMERRRAIEKKMRDVFERYGYREIVTPTIENMSLFTMKSGEGIVEETYAFNDKSGRMLALRPELTAPAMRFYLEKLQMEPKPLKIYYFGNCFRYDRPQKGRYREFWQMGCELIGSDKPEAIAELISTAYFVLKEAGLKNVQLRTGDLDILRSSIEKLGVEKADEIMRLIDKSDYEGVESLIEEKSGADEFMEFLKCRDFKSLGKFFDDVKIKRLGDVLEWLSVFGTPYILDTSIARGLDYYKGIVFEIDAPSLGAEKQLCGGGEYSLIPLLGGKDVPTSGFAIGFDRIVLALEKEGFSFPPSKEIVCILPIGGEMRKEAISLATKLREKGIMVEVDLMRRSMQKSLQYADRIRAKFAIIVGPDEWKKGTVIIKNMQSGEQKEVRKKELHNFL
ncbi:MAG: histidine--tRNA ligase [Candidatus Thermoplasmatota archaeon]|nr:histidine--tRNA ligase [Candidatus Thermoplasmatota archaeon]